MDSSIQNVIVRDAESMQAKSVLHTCAHPKFSVRWRDSESHGIGMEVCLDQSIFNLTFVILMMMSAYSVHQNGT